MAISWHLEPWRKLYTRLTGEWLRLSVSARGLADELIKYARDDGSIVNCGEDDPADTIAYMLSAKPREHQRIRDDFAELVADGYLTVDGAGVKIRNFSEAQTRLSPNAIRQKRWRTKSQGVKDGVTGDVTGNVTVRYGRDVDPKRNEEKRTDPQRTAGPTGPDRAGPDSDGPTGPLDFEAVYAAYPRHEGRKKGLQRFKAQITTREKYDALVRAMANYAAAIKRERTEAKFIKHFDTFMNCWEDYAGTSTPKSFRKEPPKQDPMLEPGYQNPLDDLFGPRRP